MTADVFLNPTILFCSTIVVLHPKIDILDATFSLHQVLMQISLTIFFTFFQNQYSYFHKSFNLYQKRLRNLLPEITKISHIVKCHWPLFQHCGLSSCTIKLMGFLIRERKKKQKETDQNK